jgi:transcriptional regulator with XRE-family HTH domain
MVTVEAMTLDADILKRLRARAGLTQQQLADRAGLSIALVLGLEQGKRDNPRLDTLRKLARGLGCTVGELVGDESPPAAKPARKPKGK